MTILASPDDNERETGKDGTKLKLSDRIWVALAIISFVIAFAIILVFGVF